MTNHTMLRAAPPRVAGIVLLILGASIARAPTAHGVEIIPSVGMTRPVEGSTETKSSAGLALRGTLLPVLNHEIALSYRSESRFDDALRVRMYPVTASLWLAPVPAIYAGGGVGFYNTTLDYDQDVVPLVEDETRQEFGVHLGGGVRVPVTPMATVDLQGRYVMMREQENRLVPERFDPDFWNASLGLAFRF